MAHILSVIVAVLETVASAGGLLPDGLYRDNLVVTTAWKGNDVVTFFVAVPLWVAALIFSARGSLGTQLKRKRDGEKKAEVVEDIRLRLFSR